MLRKLVVCLAIPASAAMEGCGSSDLPTVPPPPPAGTVKAAPASPGVIPIPGKRGRPSVKSASGSTEN